VGTASAVSNAEFNEKTVRIGLVQGGVSQLGLDFNATPREVFERHFKQTERLLHRKDLDLIVWPENASDLDPTSDKEISKRIDSILEEAQVPLLIGAVTQSPQGPENVSILYEYGRGEVSRYQKRDLVPFGEYIPLRSFVKNLSSLVDGIKDFVPGREATVQKLASMRFVPMICYEVLDDEIAHSAIAASNIGVVQTNNATFGRSPQSAQQFEMTRVRAYESRIPIIVAATTGRTALIDGDGKVVKSLEDFVSDVLVVETAPQDPSIPPFKAEYLFSVSLIFCAFSFLRALKRRERESKVLI
jgi:apolipoprotein N-acyltransferase